MGRFLVSLLAGFLLVVGVWVGWSRSEDIGDAVAGGVAGVVGADLPSLGATAASCPLPPPSGAEGMNTMVQRLDREPALLGGDHGGSVRLADGRDLFVFGDTVRDPDLGGPFMVRNSMFVTDGGCPVPVPSSQEGEALIPDDGPIGYWPMSLRATPTPDGTTVQVVAARVRGLGAYDQFETLGSSLATFEVPDGGMPRFTGQADLGPVQRDPRAPTWGAAMWESDGWVYVFGTASNATKTTSGWSLRVARVRPGALADVSAWEYWDGDSWVAGEPTAAHSDAAALVPAEMGVSHVLSVFERDGSWYAVSKEGDYLGDTLAVWKAPSVTGPYAKHAVEPLPNDENLRRYTPLAHPDIPMASGQLLVSWSESPTSEQGYLDDPGDYRIHFTEITLP